MKRKQLSKKDIKDLNESLNVFGLQDFISKKSSVELVEDKIVFVDNKPFFFYHNEKLVPTLKLLQENNFLKIITVDMGAVKFVAGGADIMRQGITEVEDNIKKDEIIAIIDTNNKKPLAIGIALFNTEELRNMSEGKVIQNIHYVGDEIWQH